MWDFDEKELSDCLIEAGFVNRALFRSTRGANRAPGANIKYIDKGNAFYAQTWPKSWIKILSWIETENVWGPKNAITGFLIQDRGCLEVAFEVQYPSPDLEKALRKSFEETDSIKDILEINKTSNAIQFRKRFNSSIKENEIVSWLKEFYDQYGNEFLAFLKKAMPNLPNITD